MTDAPAPEEKKGPRSALVAGGIVLALVAGGIIWMASDEPTLICAALPVGFGIVAVALLMLTPPVKRGAQKPPT